jgi:hypothetical protein
MGALSTLIFGGDTYSNLESTGWRDLTPVPATLKVGMTEADFSNKNLGSGGATIISAWISHNDNGALTSLNLAANNLGQIVLPEGWSGPDNDCEYKDPDGECHYQVPAGSKPEGIIALANAIRDMGALTKFDISTNSLYAAGAKALAEGLKGNQVITELIIADNNLGFTPGVGLDVSGVIALADVIPDMGVLSKKLDASDNSMFGMEDKAGILAWADALKANTSITELNLAKNGIDADDAKILALAISDNGAMTSLNLASNDIGGWFDEGDFVATPEGIAALYCTYPTTCCFSYRC